MQVELFSLGPLETNSFLAIEGDKAIAVDIGGDPAPVLKYLERSGLTLSHILLTHLHFDHTFGAQALHTATGAPILAGAGDGYLLQTELGRGGFMGFPEVPAFTFEPLAPGETAFLDQPCIVLETPGHTPGSLSFYFPKAGVVFSGDVIFYRSVGRSDFPGGSHDTLVESVRSRIFTLPPETVIYCGHGLDTTVEQEMLHNPYFSDFSR